MEIGDQYTALPIFQLVHRASGHGMGDVVIIFGVEYCGSRYCHKTWTQEGRIGERVLQILMERLGGTSFVQFVRSSLLERRQTSLHLGNIPKHIFSGKFRISRLFHGSSVLTDVFIFLKEIFFRTEGAIWASTPLSNNSRRNYSRLR